MQTENELILEMEYLLRKKMEKDYEKGKTKRDAHPKCLGLLKANFKVLDTIPDEFKVGLFQNAITYKSWIRISNASGKIQSDQKKDFRGFSIKLLNVKGERFTLEEENTQDFLLMSIPTMPLGTVKLFRDAVYYSIKWHPLLLALKFLFSGRKDVLKALQKGKKNHTSPLEINYWSTTPYALGEKKVKYKIVPASKKKSVLPKKLTDHYLTKNMSNHLYNENAYFDFYIQEFINDLKTPIEDAGIEWKEADSPFIKVAEIQIPRQVFDVKERFENAEHLSFSPANALKIHQPLGGINRARIEIYKALSKFRHQRNELALIEPKESEFESTK
jgi:catalase